ncbi:MAG: hypothetical protein COZ91_00250 [Candidatus Nealsonbacteria bacterium CG_4_8_14_3_um_filter_39_7]|uniref:NYN domain-containing protein n=1 Tax=Candidatus Nealsonbacteria bacterium CG23_combo_of_CG06-09_8_20_14_all_39_17 TaxID=1974722 RepID=A0A2G9YWN0_9BACT|nr:MAG: hypothetical protein COX37_00140 [Candidatus Nealsonbacteria bacterium CG23_combo_of_CG06-09_8_20_14_all_39_17]PIW91741.1 MAG: hypothetical protein COZ91_00250 [Candidatus Nealsonbacteria bacterium CG_4_8_14_3_um_filter_39_7]
MTKIKHPGQRVAILIDVQNLYHSAKNLYNSRVNFSEILKLAVSKRTLIRALAYVVRTKTGEEKPFFEALTKLGIETRIRDLQEFYGGMKKADWDVGISIDAIRVAPNVDTIVLASGDGDFIQLIDYLKNQGKRVEIIAFGKTTSARLKETADEFIDLGETLETSLLKNKVI